MAESSLISTLTSNNNTNSVVLEVSLTKAQKIMTKLTELLKQHEIVSKPANRYAALSSDFGNNGSYKTVVNVSYSMSNPMDKQQFVDSVTRVQEEEKKRLDTYIKLYKDTRMCKDAIFCANVASGLSDVLSQLEVCQKLKSIANNMQQSMSKEDSSKWTQDVSKAYDNGLEIVQKEGSDITSFSVMVPLFESKTLEEAAFTLSKSIDSLEDKRDLLNASTKVKLNFSQETRTLLGMK